MKVKVFSMEGCPHCDNLKEQLKESNIDFIELDVDKYDELYKKFSEKVDNDFLPAIMIGKTAFLPVLPDRSFNTINEAVDLVKQHLQVL
jgi:glutaredoxin